MMKDMDTLLYEALSPTEEMSDALKRSVLRRVRERKEKPVESTWNSAMKGNWIQRAAVAAAVLFALTSVTAVAAWKVLSANKVAELLEDETLSEAFLAEAEDFSGMESIRTGGYDITLLGLVSGKDISDRINIYNGEVVDDMTYAVVAIENADKTPMADTSDDAYGSISFLASPYIEGYDPARYNIFTLKSGGYSEIVRDGIRYRLMSTENIEAFADHTIYLGVTDGVFYNRDAFVYDEASGEIRRNEAYEGVNALFTLPVDPSKADREKARQIIDAVEHWEEEMSADENALSDNDEAAAFMQKLTPETIDSVAMPCESTRQTLTPDAEGVYSYSYELANGAAGSGTVRVDDMFPDGRTGMSDRFTWSASEDGLSSLIIETHTLNADHTVTYVVYVPREQ